MYQEVYKKMGVNIYSLISNDTYKVLPRNSKNDQNVFSEVLDFKSKWNLDRKIHKYKAILCVRVNVKKILSSDTLYMYAPVIAC